MAAKEFIRCLEIATKIRVTLKDEELNYGPGIGRADNYCKKNEWLIVFEIELKQRHPEMNVIKAWRYLEANPEKKILLIHFITDTNEVSPNRVELCDWIGEKMMKYLNDRFRYRLFKNLLPEERLNLLKQEIEKL